MQGSKLPVEVVALLRRMYERLRSYRAVARESGHDRHTIRKYLRDERKSA